MGISFNPIPAVRKFVEDEVKPVAKDLLDKAEPVAKSLWDKAEPVAKRVWDEAKPLAPVRDALRDGAVSAWNRLPGNDAVESVVGNLADRLPFNNAAGAALRALAGAEHITLDKDALEAIKQDPGFVKAEKEIVEDIKNHPDYGKGPVDIPLSALKGAPYIVELGGTRGQSPLEDQLRNAWNPTDKEVVKTWGVAGNELTWLMRHATLDGTAHVAKDGSITIDYTIKDTLDLSPTKGREGLYNDISTVTGAVWHGILGGEKPEVTGSFTSEVA